MTGSTTNTDGKDSDVGDEAQRKRRKMMLQYPTEHGVVTNCKDQKDSDVGDEGGGFSPDGGAPPLPLPLHAPSPHPAAAKSISCTLLPHSTFCFEVASWMSLIAVVVLRGAFFFRVFRQAVPREKPSVQSISV